MDTGLFHLEYGLMHSGGIGLDGSFCVIPLYGDWLGFV